MKLQDNHRYRDRLGNIHVVTRYMCDDDYPFVDQRGARFTEDGRYYAAIPVYDLVEEIHE